MANGEDSFKNYGGRLPVEWGLAIKAVSERIFGKERNQQWLYTLGAELLLELPIREIGRRARKIRDEHEQDAEALDERVHRLLKKSGAYKKLPDLEAQIRELRAQEGSRGAEDGEAA